MADEQMATAWRETPTIFAEMVIGHAHAAGIARVVLGEVSFNPEPGATLPLIRPVLNLTIPVISIPSLIASLTEIQNNVAAQAE